MTMNSRAIINSEQGWWGTPRFSWIFSDYDESVLGYSLEVLREDLFSFQKENFYNEAEVGCDDYLAEMSSMITWDW